MVFTRIFPYRKNFDQRNVLIKNDFYRAVGRVTCLVFGHRLRFERVALEGGKIFRCERCGLMLWKTPDGWHDLGRD